MIRQCNFAYCTQPKVNCSSKSKQSSINVFYGQTVFVSTVKARRSVNVSAYAWMHSLFDLSKLLCLRQAQRFDPRHATWVFELRPQTYAVYVTHAIPMYLHYHGNSERFIRVLILLISFAVKPNVATSASHQPSLNISDL